MGAPALPARARRRSRGVRPHRRRGARAGTRGGGRGPRGPFLDLGRWRGRYSDGPKFRAGCHMSLPINLPIALTLFRIVLVPLIIVFAISSDRVRVLIAAVIFVAASLTDWLDGTMARRRNQVTRFGTLLDPVADKLLVAAALVALVQVDM